MNRAMYSAATGMNAQQLNVDTISNNIANVNTVGFKRSRADFKDLFYETLQQAGSATSTETQQPNGIQIGQGTTLAATKKSFTPGMLKNTDQKLDIAIQGDGFLQVTLPSGEIAYTRNGSLSVDGEGRLVTNAGYPITPEITFEEGTREINISDSGLVQAAVGASEEMADIETIMLAKFMNPAGLKSAGKNLFVPTNAAGEPTEGTPGEEGMGELKQGFLEVSNVKIIEEMVDLIQAQRAYEINSKTIQASDSMLQTANAIKR